MTRAETVAAFPVEAQYLTDYILPYLIPLVPRAIAQRGYRSDGGLMEDLRGIQSVLAIVLAGAERDSENLSVFHEANLAAKAFSDSLIPVLVPKAVATLEADARNAQAA